MKRLTLKKHFKELLVKLFKILNIVILTGVLIFPYSWNIFYIASHPIVKLVSNDNNFYFICKNITEVLSVEIKIAIMSTMTINLPIIIYNIYNYIALGLYKKEKVVALLLIKYFALLTISSLLWIYLIIIPILWHFFLSFGNSNTYNKIPIYLQITIKEYIDSVLLLFIIFSVVLKLIVILLLFKKKFLNSNKEFIYRKYIRLLTLFISATVAPPNVYTHIVFALPFLLLYELCRLLIKSNAQDKIRNQKFKII